MCLAKVTVVINHPAFLVSHKEYCQTVRSLDVIYQGVQRYRGRYIQLCVVGTTVNVLMMKMLITKLRHTRAPQIYKPRFQRTKTLL